MDMFIHRRPRVGNVSSIMLRVYQGTEEFQEHQTSIKEFIRFHRIPSYLAKRLLEYWQYTWAQTNGIDMSGVLSTFPQCLQADICLHLNGMLLTKFPAFQKANQGTYG
jgi:potassium voltage-gated channel Eag-related subfamily H member 2